MKISLNWLRDFVDLPRGIDPATLAEQITLKIVEVEGFEREADAFEKMVVGEVVNIEKHPNADRLSVCKVEAGCSFLDSRFRGNDREGGVIEVVCGGKNLREGMLVAVALPGSKVKWHGEGELVELKEAEVRGVKSYGMICAGSEIGLDDLQARQPVVGEGPQILDISFTRAKPGTPLASALGKDDVIFEISNVSISNRPDLWSHIGFARELSVLLNKPLRLPKVSNEELRMKNKGELKVIIQARDLCPRYIGALVERVQTKATPAWMQQRLLAVGQRPINPLVDISNYVMLEMGQPVHIFDESRIRNHESGRVEIVVRRARKGEKMKTLDGVVRQLDDDMLVIADAEKPLAIAGVMGGEDSGVDEKTNSIIIECATFEPVSIRKTSATLGLETDAAQRFEKSLDPNLPGYAVARVLQLIKECGTAPAALSVKAVVDVHVPIRAPKPIVVPFDFIGRRLGAPVPQEKAKKILQGLGFIVRGTAKIWKVTPPSWRATRDISLPEDVVEEIGRHLDYNTIPDALPSFPVTPPVLERPQQLERAFKRFLAGAGFYEVEHKPFLDPSAWEPLGLERGDHVEVVNPVDPDARYLRQSLLPGLFGDLHTNKDEADSLKLFEWGRIFLPEPGAYAVKKGARAHVPAQPLTLSFVLREAVDAEELLRRLKGTALSLLQAAGLQGEIHPHTNPAGGYVSNKIQSATSATPQFREKPQQVMGIGVGAAFRGETVFSIFAHGIHVGGGSVASEALKAALGMSGRQALGAVSIDIDALAKAPLTVKRYTPLPIYPAIQRDVAIVVDEGVPYADMEKTLRSSAGAFLISLELFDVFRGKGIPDGKRSLALRLTFRAPDKTLRSEEAAEEMTKIVRTLEKSFGAVIRN